MKKVIFLFTVLLLGSCTKDSIDIEEHIVENPDSEITLKPVWTSISLIAGEDKPGYDTVQVIYDFNGDGFDDVLYAPSVSDMQVIHTPLELYVNQGDNLTFILDSSIIDNNIGPVTARKAATGDFNADGKLDVFFADHSIHTGFPGGTPSVLVSKGDRYEFKFIEGIEPAFYHTAAAGDFDNDGMDEIFVGAYNSPRGVYSYIVEYENGTFTPYGDEIDLKCASLSAEFYDVNKDGNLDIVHGGFNQAWIYYGNGKDFLSEPIQIAGENEYHDVYDIDFYDINSDGSEEIFLRRFNPELTTGYIEVVTKNENGEYVVVPNLIERNLSHSHHIVWCEIGDITGDGKINFYETENHNDSGALWQLENGYFKLIRK